MKKIMAAAIVLLVAAGVFAQSSNEILAKKDVKNQKSVQKVNQLMLEGAGKSGKIPTGLSKAKGIQKKLGRDVGTTTPSVIETAPEEAAE